jgi:1,4-dihydroxy-2-naphthoate octaprenyltransferase
MKLPEFNNITVSGGLTTIGLLGVSLTVLVALDKISEWWLILSVLCILIGVGMESGKRK